MGTTSNFDLTQTAYLFNWIANSACITSANPNLTPTAQSQSLADFVYCSLYGTANGPTLTVNSMFNLPGLIPTLRTQLLGGDWNLVWGPGVYQFSNSEGRADNTAFVVYSKSLDTYMVAIAGTNPAAFLDWLTEDMQVGKKYCVNWDGFSPTGSSAPTASGFFPKQSQISLGTAVGVWALASQLTLSQAAPAQGITLMSYLQGITGSKTTRVIFTGHSLGGALAPTLAFWAKGGTTAKAGTKSGMSAFNGTILVMPTAGPTPGNVPYQAAWDTAFTSATVPANSGNAVTALNLNVWNLQDVVPHAWTNIFTQTAGQMPQTYFYSKDKILALDSAIGSTVPFPGIGNAVVAAHDAGADATMAAAKNSTPFLIGQNGVPSWPIQYYADGSLNQMPQPPTSPAVWPTDEQFLAALGTIHVWGYGSFAFNIDFSVFQAIHPVPVLAATAKA